MVPGRYLSRKVNDMINLYACSKCHKTFEDYEECERHENAHYTLERSAWCSKVDVEALETSTEYKSDVEEPVVIHMPMSRWNYEKGEYEYRCGKYKLVSSYEAPLIIEADPESDTENK